MKQSTSKQARLSAAVVAAAMLAGATATLAAPGDVINQYFPLHEADRWVYVRTDAHGIDNQPQNPYPLEEVQTVDSFRRGADRIFRVQNYGFGIGAAEVDFFNDPAGQTVEFDQTVTGIWYRWGGIGSTVELPDFGADCMHGSGGVTIAMGAIRVPAGDFDEALTIRYDTRPCAEQGLLSETFAPNLGLVQRRLLTAAGIQTWSLRLAVINGYSFGGPIVAGPPAPSEDGAETAYETLPVAPSTWGAIKSAFQE